MAETVIEMFARDLNLRQADIQDALIAWNSIRSLRDVEGWKHLSAFIGKAADVLRAKIVDGNVEDTSFARGELKALMMLVQSPSLAEAHIIALGQAQQALDADKEDFILTGAEDR